MILIHINNAPTSLAEPTSLMALLSAQNVAIDAVAIVLNSAVVPRHKWASVICQHEDRIDIFSVVAGG